MWFHYDRNGHYRGYSTRLGFWIAAGAIIVILGLAVGYQLFMLAPVLGLVALAVLAWRSEIRRIRARRAEKTGT